LKQTLDHVDQITRGLESITAQMKRDTTTIATLTMQSRRSGGRTPANQQTTALPTVLQGVAQSLVRQRALGKQLINDVALFAAALNRWGQDLEKDNVSPTPSIPVLSGGNETTESDDARTPDPHHSISRNNSGGRPGVLIFTNNWNTYTRYTGSNRGFGLLTSAYVTYVGDDSTNLYLATNVSGAIQAPIYDGVAYCYRITINSDESWYYYSAKDAQTKAEEGAFIAITSLTPSMTGFSAAGESVEDFQIAMSRIKINYVPPADAGIKWGSGIKAQGIPWEDYLESTMPSSLRLPPGFETFDFLNPAAGNATSAKTLYTLTVSRMTKPAQLYQMLVKYIDEAAEFSEADREEFEQTSSRINLRIMQVAIPSGTTAEQMQQLDAAAQYGRSRGVIVIIRKAK
jgi:hypothetical protein